MEASHLPVSGRWRRTDGTQAVWAAAARLRLCPGSRCSQATAAPQTRGFLNHSPGSRGTTRTMTSNAAMATVDWCPQLWGQSSRRSPARGRHPPRWRANGGARASLPTLLPSPLGQLLYSVLRCRTSPFFFFWSPVSPVPPHTSPRMSTNPSPARSQTSRRPIFPHPRQGSCDPSAPAPVTPSEGRPFGNIRDLSSPPTPSHPPGRPTTPCFAAVTAPGAIRGARLQEAAHSAGIMIGLGGEGDVTCWPQLPPDTRRARRSRRAALLSLSRCRPFTCLRDCSRALPKARDEGGVSLMHGLSHQLVFQSRAGASVRSDSCEGTM